MEGNAAAPAGLVRATTGGADLEGREVCTRAITLKPGPHTLQLLFGDKDHVPHSPPVMSHRVRVVVAEPQPQAGCP